jgi:hypothetical protein
MMSKIKKGANTARLFTASGTAIARMQISTPSPSGVLIDGLVNPTAWNEFATNDLTFSDGASANLDYEAPARMITPPFFAWDDADHHLISVVCPPYLGVKTNGQINKVSKVEFYLNGGPAATATSTESSRGYATYSIAHPFASTEPTLDTNEVRAIIYYEEGIPRILQGIATETSGHLDAHPGFTAKFDNRGCFIGKYVDYYVGPSGNDSNNGTSEVTAKATIQGAYTQAATDSVKNVRVNNLFSKVRTGSTPGSFTYSGCLTAADLYIERRNMTSLTPPGDVSTDFVHRQTLPPIVTGGDCYINNDSQPYQRCGGVAIKSVRCYLNPTINENVAINGCVRMRNKNKGDAFGAYTDYSAIIFDNCTIGPEATSDSHGGNFGEIEDSSFYSDFGGYTARSVDAGSAYTGETCWFGCSVLYGNLHEGREAVDVSIMNPPAKNDIANNGLNVNVSVHDINMFMYPWGSIGSPKDAELVDTTMAFGSAIPIDATSVSYADTEDVSNAAINSRVPLSNAPTSLGSSFYDKGFWPDYQGLQQTTIVMSGITEYSQTSETPWATTLITAGPVDPHLDFNQINRPYTNVVQYNNTLSSRIADFQGWFWADEARVEISACWNNSIFVPDMITRDLSMNAFSFGSEDENNSTANGVTGRFQHYGPNLVCALAENRRAAIDLLSNAHESAVLDCWIYDSGLDFNQTTPLPGEPNAPFILGWDISLASGTNAVPRSEGDLPDTNTGTMYTQVSDNLLV